MLHQEPIGADRRRERLFVCCLFVVCCFFVVCLFVCFLFVVCLLFVEPIGADRRRERCENVQRIKMDVSSYHGFTGWMDKLTNLANV